MFSYKPLYMYVLSFASVTTKEYISMSVQKQYLYPWYHYVIKYLIHLFLLDNK